LRLPAEDGRIRQLPERSHDGAETSLEPVEAARRAQRREGEYKLSLADEGQPGLERFPVLLGDLIDLMIGREAVNGFS